MMYLKYVCLSNYYVSLSRKYSPPLLLCTDMNNPPSRCHLVIIRSLTIMEEEIDQIKAISFSPIWTNKIYEDAATKFLLHVL